MLCYDAHITKREWRWHAKKILSVMVVSVIVGLVVGGGVRPVLTSAVVPGVNVLVSENNTGNGQGGNDGSSYPRLSDNGKFIAFQSSASNLVGGDTNNSIDVFLKNLATNTISRVSISPTGAQLTGYSELTDISENGRYVIFVNDGNVYMFNQRDSSVEKINTNSAGQSSNYPAEGGYVSNDGRFVAFTSRATNLGPVITTKFPESTINPDNHAFVKDRKLNTITLLDQNSSGESSNNKTYVQSMSCDGSFLTLWSVSSDMTQNDNNGKYDVFLVDRRAGYEVTSVTGGDQEGGQGTLSCNGSYVAFGSATADIVSGVGDGKSHTYRYDRLSKEFTLADKSTSGNVANTYSSGTLRSVADNGSIIFASTATNLVPEVVSGSIIHVYMNRITGETDLISINSTGSPANTHAFGVTVDKNAKLIGFHSEADNLVTSDTNSEGDIFLRELDY